jgi:hypothetical protein
MKTPIQELIDEMTYMLTEGESNIYALREKAKSLLEKEEEVIMSAYEVSHISMMTAEQYYNETFRTK